mgnify:FL=1
MAFSEADYIVAQRRFNRVPLNRFYPHLGMDVAAEGKAVNVTRGSDSYATTAERLRLDVEAEVLQDYLAGAMGRQAFGGVSVLERIERDIAAERKAAAEAAA